MKPIRCLFGMHKGRWNVTLTDPQLNWRECIRCGTVLEEQAQYERYQQATTNTDKEDYE